MTIGTSDATTELTAIAPPSSRVPPIAAAEYAARIDRARGLTAAAGAGALLVHAGASLRYFTGRAVGRRPSGWSRCCCRSPASR